MQRIYSLFFVIFATAHCSQYSENTLQQIVEKLRDVENKVASQQAVIRMLEEKLETNCQCGSLDKPFKVQTWERRDITEGPVAFTAAVKPVTVDHVKSNQVITFETIVTNIGDAYNNVTGIFTVPLSGLYVFSCSVLDHIADAHGGTMIHAEIVLNGHVLVRVFAHADVHYRDQGANTVYTRAAKGDRVWVRTVHQNDLSLGGELYSTFSGYMLWQE